MAGSATGYGTKALLFESIRNGRPSGGAARWGQSRRSQTRQPIPMGVAADVLLRSRPSEYTSRWACRISQPRPMAKVLPERAAEDGYDGSWVARPALVPVCREVFEAVLGERPHQLDRTREDVEVTAADLLSVRRVSGPPTPEGLRTNIAVAVRYFDAWLGGRGAVALDGLMEDAATAEIARVQIWQWLRHRVVDRETVLAVLDAQLAALGAEHPWAALAEVRALFERTALAQELPLFTPNAYARHLVRHTEVTS